MQVDDSIAMDVGSDLSEDGGHVVVHEAGAFTFEHWARHHALEMTGELFERVGPARPGATVRNDAPVAFSPCEVR